MARRDRWSFVDKDDPTRKKSLSSQFNNPAVVSAVVSRTRDADGKRQSSRRRVTVSEPPPARPTVKKENKKKNRTSNTRTPRSAQGGSGTSRASSRRRVLTPPPDAAKKRRVTPISQSKRVRSSNRGEDRFFLEFPSLPTTPVSRTKPYADVIDRAAEAEQEEEEEEEEGEEEEEEDNLEEDDEDDDDDEEEEEEEEGEEEKEERCDVIASMANTEVRVVDVYREAKARLMLTYVPGDMVGREEESGAIYDFLLEALTATTAQLTPGNAPAKKKVNRKKTVLCVGATPTQSLCVTGPPGTGKTATLTRMLKGNRLNRCTPDGQRPPPLRFYHTMINCVHFVRPTEIFSSIRAFLGGHGGGDDDDDDDMHLTDSSEVEEMLATTDIPIVLVMDEMDSLASRDQTVLLTLFDWVNKYPLVLVGLSNSLNITESFLKRLSEENCEPATVIFGAYDKNAIKAIVDERLKDLPFTVVDDKAIALCATKIANRTGDVRKALDMCRTSISKLMDSTSQSLMYAATPATGSVTSSSSSWSPISTGLPSSTTTSKPPTVTLRDMVRLSSSIMGAAAYSNEIERLPLQQQLLLYAATCMLKDKRPHDVNKLRRHFVRVCRKCNVGTELASNSNTFRDILMGVEGTLLSLKRKGVNEIVQLLVQKDDVDHALRNNRLISFAV